MTSLLLIALSWLGAEPASQPVTEKPEVVVYTALDRIFSEPILQEFEKQTGIKVLAVYDTESTKTIGLTNKIRAEKERPRCDVFWNNEIVNTVRLKEEGLLQPCRPPNAEYYPAEFRDADGFWYGFAARARVLIVNTKLVAEGEEPKSIFDLTDPKWKGKVGIAKPMLGTTASQVACLFAALDEQRAVRWLDDLKANDIRILGGNKLCAEAVGQGILSCALTDTDDALIEIESGSPVRIVYLDTGPDQIGTLFIPNTLAVIKNCPHPRAAEQMINYLLSAEVEARLAAGPSAQIPLRRDFTGACKVKTPNEVSAMKVDFSRAAACFEQSARYIEERFLK